jgi:hypothetical protein
MHNQVMEVQPLHLVLMKCSTVKPVVGFKVDNQLEGYILFQQATWPNT